MEREEGAQAKSKKGEKVEEKRKEKATREKIER